MDGGASVIIIMTRWHEDDLVGRLTDPQNIHYDPEEAATWKKIDLPALAEANDPLGRAEGEALWPERFPRESLLAKKRVMRRSFSALYQGRPTTADGDYFKAAHLVEYMPHELPRRLRMYAASDHALSKLESADSSCFGCVGVCENDYIWVMPDLDWGKFSTDVLVEMMLAQMKRHRPFTWWAESEHISKSIGPFLFKRMKEEQVYIPVEMVASRKDIELRAQAIRGRMAMQMVRFPKHAPWWTDARDQLLKFPNGTHDDVVSFLSLVGGGLESMIGLQQGPKASAPVEGTFGHMLAETKARERNRFTLITGGA
jgi:predicted phage terminase large subunit-like protein